ncbi:MAG: hypothetical protein FJ112_01280, partial [Deltaproteobacteria bacterium]|nr:hypothetical protein [Deltaproteobacteria bacterium]
MGQKFKHWYARTPGNPSSFENVKSLLLLNRAFEPIDKLQYGDHGLEATLDCISAAIKGNKRIAL